MRLLFYMFVIGAILVLLGFGSAAWLAMPLAIVLWLKTLD